MAFKIEINGSDCIGCGACVAACPANFEMNGDKATVKEAEVAEKGDNEAAAESCPVNCIKITEI